MRGKRFITGLLTVAGVFAWGGASRGDDTIRLNRGTNAPPAKNLVGGGQDAETIRACWYPGFGLGYGGFYYPYPYYSFGLGYGLGFGGLGYSRFSYGLGFGGLGYGFGYRYGGFYPGFGFGGLFGPCAGATASVYTLNMPAVRPGTPLPRTDPVPTPRNEGTFPYDGGPSNPAPNPKAAPPSKTITPPSSAPREGRFVSLPKAPPKWSYPAYGETARRRTSPPPSRTYLTRGQK